MSSQTTARPTAKDRICAALWFAERGFGVFSVWSPEEGGACHCPKGKKCEQPGKHPIGRHGFKEATSDPATITTLLSAGSEPNYGLLCPPGIFALDVDGEGIAHLAELEARLGPLPPTLRTATAHGQHIFLAWPADRVRPEGQLFGYVSRWGSGSDQGYVIGPESWHASGVAYDFAGECFDVTQLPEAWVAEAEATRQAPTGAIVVTGGGYELPAGVAEGGRYEAIRSYVAHLYNQRHTPAEMWLLVRDNLAPTFTETLPEPDLRARFERATKSLEQRLGTPRVPGERVARSVSPDPGPGIDAADLLAMDIPALRMIVPDLLPEGTSIIAAPPKVGKSCLVYQIVTEVAIGGDLLGRRVTPGSALYLALEDGERRGQDRLRAALAGRTMPHGRLEIRWAARRIGEGLEEDLSAWLDEHDDAAVVAIDTLQRVRPAGDSRRNAYAVDVEDMGRLQDLFRDRSTALLIVHHSHKATGDDFLASVSGTYGITGSADTTIVINRKRLEAFGKITVTGRDIAESEISVRFDDLLWHEAPISLPEASFERLECLRVIEEQGPIFPAAIAAQIGLERTSVQHMVQALVDLGAVSRGARGYVKAGIALSIPSTSNHSKSVWSSGPDTRVYAGAPAREAGEAEAFPDDNQPAGEWWQPCLAYADHQHSHRQTERGWTCDACYPPNVVQISDRRPQS